MTAWPLCRMQWRMVGLCFGGRSGRVSLAFESVASLSEAIEATPDEPIGGDDHERDEDSAKQDNGELAIRGGCIDLLAEAKGGERAAVEREVLGEDAGVPCAAG